MKRIVNTLLSTLNKIPAVNTKLAALSSRYLSIHRNFDYNHDSNGERWLLHTLARRSQLSVCFDVGANHGDWTMLVLEENPRATVHSFELSPPTFESLARRFLTDSRVKLNPVGLSNQAGNVQVQHCLDGDGLSSMIEVVLSENINLISSKVLRGADYCAERRIDKIDFLKVDVEGAENLVLEGFAGLITPSAVPVVQFEYGMANIASRFLLRDFYRLFEGCGYRVGKLFPHEVRFRNYHFEDEDFRGPNFIAAAPEVAAWLETDKA